MLLALLVGCAVHASRTGLVQPGDDPVRLLQYNGGTVRLKLDEESAPIKYLDHCVVVVEGPRVGSSVVVRDWHVQDSGDGSSGFVGTLRVYGARLVIDDRNTRRTLVIADDTAGPLVPYAGKPVLLMGHVIGGETIEVAAWRLLAPEEGSSGEATGAP
jgi:hypothetical protein